MEEEQSHPDDFRESGMLDLAWNSPEGLGQRETKLAEAGFGRHRQAAQAKRGWLGLRFGWRVLILANLAAGWLGPRLKDEGCLPFSLSLSLARTVLKRDEDRESLTRV